MRFFILQRPRRIEYNDHALSMKYSVFNIQLLPKAVEQKCSKLGSTTILRIVGTSFAL